MEITLHLMTLDEKPLLVRLMELYNYEFTAYDDSDISEFGFYGYSRIDDYWNEEGRYPYLIHADGKIAGFALVCPHCWFRKEPDARSIGEFFVMLKYRRKGIGSVAAKQLFDRHPGHWEVSFWKNNLPAVDFWKRVVREQSEGRYRETDSGDVRAGLLFDNG